MLNAFELYTPATVEEACRCRAETGGTLLAGGTDVLVAMHGGKAHTVLIDLKGLAPLQGIRETETHWHLGALTPHYAIEADPVWRARCTCLYEGCSQVGSVQIRHRGTLGGNLCNAVPSADSAGPLLALDAVCRIASPAGVRDVPLTEFFLGARRTVLGPDELLQEIVVPKPVPHTGSCYIKYTRRRAMDLALCGVTVLVTLDGGRIATARVALTTAAPTPIRAPGAEAYLQGRQADRVDLAELGRRTAADASPRTSWRASTEFRLTLLEELAGRAFTTALARAKEDPT